MPDSESLGMSDRRSVPPKSVNMRVLDKDGLKTEARGYRLS